MIFYYIRHGDPIYNPDSLTELGKRQAEAVGKRLAQHGIDKIFASTSNRAILTATPLSEITKKEIVQLDFCNESHAWDDFAVPCANGNYTWAFTHNETLKLFTSKAISSLGDKWYEYEGFKDYNFKKGVERVNRETDALLLSLGYQHIREEGFYKAINHNNERVALFAHQGFGLAFLSSLLDIPYPQFSSRFDMSHTGVTVIEFKPMDKDGMVIPCVFSLSDLSHIHKENLPTRYNNGIFI